MSGSEHARPVWLTECDVENLCVPGFPEGARFLRAAWDAAPVDPAEAVLSAFKTYEPDFWWPGKERGLPMLERPRFNALWRKGFAAEVLAALGCAKEPADG